MWQMMMSMSSASSDTEAWLHILLSYFMGSTGMKKAGPRKNPVMTRIQWTEIQTQDQVK